jgi:DNA-binding CsgD family transcriptional regulator
VRCSWQAVAANATGSTCCSDPFAAGSRAVVVRGDAGVGKTVLLEYVAKRASDFRLARAVGVQSEMELAFAGLHQLLAPMLDELDRLPVPQRDALRTVFGLSGGSAPDRFFVGLAVLSLLSEVAEEQPLVCLVDDAQWLDHESTQLLAFVARRLEAESVGLVFAARGSNHDLGGLPELVVEGLSDADAHELLDSVLTAPLDARVRDQIVSETRGNPLAMLELLRELTPAELAGGFGLPGGIAHSGSVEESYRRRLKRLPAATRRLLLLAAADPVGDPLLVWQAAAQLGIPEDAATPAANAGLLEISTRVRFRHPLVRSAAYWSSPLKERQAVHRALAAFTDSEFDPDRRAWHRAMAAPGPDEEVAEELEQAAGRARARGGVAAAAAFLERAVELTLDPSHLACRALSGAQAKLLAGAPDSALKLLVTAEAGPLSDVQRAGIEMLRGQVAFAFSRGNAIPRLLLSAARGFEPLDVDVARDIYLDALSAAMFAGRLSTSGGGAQDVARAARAASSSRSTQTLDLLLKGLVAHFCDGYAAGLPILRRALAAFDRDVPEEEQLRWLWLFSITALHVWDDERWDSLSRRHVQLARTLGAVSELPLALSSYIYNELLAGELNTAESFVEEVRAASNAVGSSLGPYGALGLAALRGRESEALAIAEGASGSLERRGEGIGITLNEWAKAILSNGLGHYAQALASAQQAIAYPHDMGTAYWALAELIEAATRTDNHDAAAEAHARLIAVTRVSRTDWALGIEARSHALLSEGAAAEALYREATDRLGRTRMRFDLARARLLYGEWLRRENRRIDAREELHAAHEMFSSMGAGAFADRARRELLATGETVRKRRNETRGELTAQEAQIARLARDGLSNPESGARLFISPRTVQYHLHKVFAKLGIQSRIQLENALPREPR